MPWDRWEMGRLSMSKSIPLQTDGQVRNDVTSKAPRATPDPIADHVGRSVGDVDQVRCPGWTAARRSGTGMRRRSPIARQWVVVHDPIDVSSEFVAGYTRVMRYGGCTSGR